ncbi:amidohydrolase [Oleiagrimonas sp. C23AA]|nr:amidohydrolase [Oleiagrimonas sp. C23AA]
MSPLTVALVQGATRWHDDAGNRAYYGALVRERVHGADLVIVPETVLTGFTNATDSQAQTMDGPGLAWMRELSIETGAVITGSLVIVEDGKHYNRLIWARPDGTWAQYDKRHLFRMAREHERYDAGRERLIVELNGWRICPMVCYDLRFPVWSRNGRQAQTAGGMDYDLLLFVANWPAPRREAWRTLLRARAIENLACVAGVNRVGTDGNELNYAGDSVVTDALGQPLIELGAQEQVAQVTLDPAALLAHRERFPAWMDADGFALKLDAGRQ